jgi:hypothetical protein
MLRSPPGPAPAAAQQVRYKVTIATSNVVAAGTDAPVLVQVVGPLGLLGRGAIHLENSTRRVRRGEEVARKEKRGRGQAGGCALRAAAPWVARVPLQPCLPLQARVSGQRAPWRCL